jgi:hypothetical protein
MIYLAEQRLPQIAAPAQAARQKKLIKAETCI